MKDIIFEKLEKGRHDRDSFDCGEAALNVFLRDMANQQQGRGLNVVYVAVQKEDKFPLKIWGFYTLSANSLSFKSLPDNISKKMPQNYPIPVIKIGRLAKDISSPKGFGGKILGVALRHALKLSNEIGIVGVDVDAKNEKARNFYLKFGFIPLQDDRKGLFMPISTLRQLYPH